MKRALLISACILTLCACDKGDAKPSGDTAKPAASAKADKGGEAKADKGGDTKAAADKPAGDVPSCEKVVSNIASFNKDSGDAEKKLWNKMCDGMSDAEKTCVAAAKDMDGMKACMKKDKKLGD